MRDIGIRGDESAFLSAAIQNGLDFVVVGGAAVAFHECREPDDVDDLDILVRPEPSNIEKLNQALRSMNTGQSVDLDEASRPSKHLSIRRNCKVDILTPHEDEVYDEIKDSSIFSVVFSNNIHVVSKPHLISMKRRAIEEFGSLEAKHKEDLLCLEAV
ncbi:MAG: hypothetical protein HOC70_13770 [Gammaproteobacteria bacterium]|nr:hypothetical protein [Gammaproteobacteria bacterium]MBT4494304.1 hypothetical protein [Gammaproteobacteria bacterium]